MNHRDRIARLLYETYGLESQWDLQWNELSDEQRAPWRATADRILLIVGQLEAL